MEIWCLNAHLTVPCGGGGSDDIVYKVKVTLERQEKLTTGITDLSSCDSNDSTGVPTISPAAGEHNMTNGELE